MDSKPLISVLIPSLNSEDYIEECVLSVCNQSFEDLEIICIDAGSSDGTVDILNKLAKDDSRIRIFHSDRRSYGYQMNTGLDNARGKYISIVESDDYIDEDMLKTLYDLAVKYDADISKTTFNHLFEDERLVLNDSKKDLKDIDYSFNLYEKPTFIHGHPSIWAGIYKASLIKDNNVRFIEEKGAGWVDNPFFYETAFLAENIVYSHVPYYYYRETNPNSSSNSLGDYTIPIRRMMDNLDVVEKYDCHDELILKEAYIRAFAYIEIVFRTEGYEEHMSVLRPLIQEMLLRFDEEIVLKHMPRKWIDMYYEYISPVKIINSDDHSLSNEDYELMLKENEYLYSRIDYYKKNKNKNDKKIKRLNNKVKSLQKEIKSIKGSKAYKLGLILAKPIRKLKSLFKSN